MTAVALPPLDDWEQFARSSRDPAALLEIDQDNLLRLRLPPSPAWMAEAARGGMSPNVFFPEKGSRMACGGTAPEP